MSRIRRKAPKHGDRRQHAKPRDRGMAQAVHEGNAHLPSAWVDGPKLLNRRMPVMGERRSYMTKEYKLRPL